jgi:hypothetical protein
MAGALTLAGEVSGDDVCEFTTPMIVTAATAPPASIAATVLKIDPTLKPLPGSRGA